MIFKVQIPNLEALQTALAEAKEMAEPIIQDAVIAGQAVLAANTTKGVVPWQTGALAQTFQTEIGRLYARWFPTRFYAPYVEFGTGIYGPKGKMIEIRPVNKAALYWPGAKHPVRKVMSLGMKPNPYMERILARSQDNIKQVFMEALGMIRSKIAEESQ